MVDLDSIEDAARSAKLEAIVREVADDYPGLGTCYACDYDIVNGDTLEHAPDCFWRRASELVGK